jgi:DNA-binding CsgD family transcriptional regulator
MSEPAAIEPPKTKRTPGRRGGVAKPLSAKAQTAVKKIHPAFRRVLERMKTLGLSTRQAVFELHARQGRTLAEVAEIMGLTLSCIYQHWQAIKDDIVANAPTTPEQFTALREEIAARLFATIENTYARAEFVDETTGKATVIEMPPCPKLLAVRLKALDQLSKLYGVNLEQQAQDGAQPPYAAPDEIADEVRQKILDLHNRPTSFLHRKEHNAQGLP